MKRPLRFLLGICFIISATALQVIAQGNRASAGDTSTVQPKQAPDDLLKKLSDLIHAGKYAEAQQSAADLLQAYPNDQRLIKAKALLDKLVAPAGATQGNTKPGQLSGMDKVEYNALLELAREAQQNTDLDQQKASLKQFMDESATFLQKYPGEMLLWQIRAASAMSLNEPAAGYNAGQRLLAGGAADSNDPNLLQLLAKLKLRGWMDKQKVKELEVKAAEEQKYRADSLEAARLKAEEAQYTLPVQHFHGLLGRSYGHLTINANDAVYEGADGTVRFYRDEIIEIKTFAVFEEDLNIAVSGLLFKRKKDGNIMFVAVAEDTVAKMTGKGMVCYPPSVIGDIILKRWHFIPDGKFLHPPAQ